METEVQAWLIERYVNSTLYYWGGKYPGDMGLVMDVNEAIKFVDHASASTVLGWLLGGNGRVAEHIWIGGQHQ